MSKVLKKILKSVGLGNAAEDRSDALPGAAVAGSRSARPAAQPGSRDGEAEQAQQPAQKNKRSNKNRAAGKEVKSRQDRKRQASKQQAEWDPSRFPVAEAEGKTRFQDLNLHNDLLHAIADLGFQYCSPIQAQILPSTLQGHDAIGKAQTGTGKTAAFCITIINDLLHNPLDDERYLGEPRALIIAPTRELVMQIANDARELCKYTTLQVVDLIGGVDYQKQSKRLHQDMVDIIVATPGRLLDCCSRKDLHLDLVELLVVDEADRMLDMGFIPQVRKIIRLTPPKTHRQTMLFSATFTEEVLRLSEQWTFEPVTVEIEPERVATDTVDQRIYMVSDSDKFTVLKNLLNEPDVESAIVFANRRDQTRWIQEKLQRAGVRCGLLSGEVAQQKRSKTLEDFRSGKIKYLVATDVAGRGIHIDGISHVINYNLPEDPEDYVHRIGRTGRAGLSGVSISFVGEDDGFLLPGIEQLLGEKIQCQTPPGHLL